MYVYFPSCQFTARYPELSGKIKAFLAERGVRVTDCCRKNYDKLEKGEIPLTICQTCRLIVEENNPQQPPMSVFVYLDGLDVQWPDHAGEVITVQDCFRAGEQEQEKAAIRSLLRKMHFEVRELEGTEEERHFDGYMLYRPVMPGNKKLAPKAFSRIEPFVHPTSQEEAAADIKRYAERFTTDVVCYCNTCAASLKEALPEERKALHLAELLFA